MLWLFAVSLGWSITKSLHSEEVDYVSNYEAFLCQASKENNQTTWTAYKQELTQQVCVYLCVSPNYKDAKLYRSDNPCTTKR